MKSLIHVQKLAIMQSIRVAIKVMGISQRQFAKLTNVSRSSISDIFSNRADHVSIERLIHLANMSASIMAWHYIE
jgi:transcriptional regulator with XRE-family HTH domain